MRILAFVYFFHFLRHSMVFPLIPLYAEKLGCSAFQIGIAVSSFSVLSMFLAIPVGKFLDKKSVKWTLFAGVVCNIVYSFLLLIAGSLEMLVLAQIFGGMGFLVLIVSSQAYISGSSDKRYVEKSFGYLSFSAAVGQTIGPYLGGSIITNLGFNSMFGLAVLFALLGVFSLKLQETGKRSEQKVSKSSGKSAELKSYLTDLPLMGVLIFTFVMVFAVSLRSSFIPVLFKSYGFTEDYLGFLLSLFALCMTLVRLGMGQLLHRCSRIFLLYTAFIFALVGVSILPHFSDKIVLAVAMIVFGTGFGISQPLSMVMVSDRSAGRTPGTAMGVRFTTITLATFISPLISGFLVDAVSLEAAFYLPSILITAAMGFIVFML